MPLLPAPLRAITPLLITLARLVAMYPIAPDALEISEAALVNVVLASGAPVAVPSS